MRFVCALQSAPLLRVDCGYCGLHVERVQWVWVAVHSKGKQLVQLVIGGADVDDVVVCNEIEIGGMCVFVSFFNFKYC